VLLVLFEVNICSSSFSEKTELLVEFLEIYPESHELIESFLRTLEEKHFQISIFCLHY